MWCQSTVGRELEGGVRVSHLDTGGGKHRGEVCTRDTIASRAQRNGEQRADGTVALREKAYMAINRVFEAD